MSYFHQSVLLKETIELLNPRPNQHFIDCTLGGGGHAAAILERTGPKGKLLGIDLDKNAIEYSRRRLKKFFGRYILVQDNFKNINKIKNEQFPNFTINGVLADLGLSSNQLQGRSGAGFSFQTDGQLDMRFDQSQSLTAEEIVNTYPIQKLIKIFKEYGEENLASLIAQKITAFRRQKKIKTTAELAEIILQAYREKLKSKKEIPWLGGLHPATKVFQALRIAVNDELNNLKKFLKEAMEILPSGDRLAVISFHSLEDRIVKKFFQTEAKDCLCPPELPVCQCGHRKIFKIITKKAVQPSAAEIKQNPRSRSARLRVVEVIRGNS